MQSQQVQDKKVLDEVTSPVAVPLQLLFSVSTESTEQLQALCSSQCQPGSRHWRPTLLLFSRLAFFTSVSNISS
eukprot:3160732-Karenia_brevis.AAC.1